MKKLLALVGVLGVVLVGLVVVTVMSINPIIEKAVNTAGPKILKTDVVLDNADVSFLSGEGKLEGLLIGSPQGFAAPQTMKLGSVAVRLDTASLTKDTIIIEKIVVESPDLTYEKAGKVDNFTALLNNVKQSVGSSQQSEGASQDEQSGQVDSAASEPAKKVIIRDLWIRNAKVNVALTALGGKGMTLDLSDIHLTNIGEKQGGASPAEAAQKIISELNNSVTKAVSSALQNVTKDLQKGIEDISKGIKEGGAKDTVEGLKKMFQ